MRQRLQPGAAGFARKGQSLAEASWVENMDLDRDGTWRPRLGLRWIGTFSGNVTHISRPAGYNNHVLVIAESGKLIDVPIEDFASRTTVDTGWPTEPIAHTFAVTTSGTNLWAAHKTKIGGSAAALKLYNNVSLADPTLAPRNGNYIGSHGATPVSLLSGDGSTNSIQYSTRGNINDWPSAQKTTPIPQCGTCDAVVSLGPNETLVFGPSGIGYIGGSDDPDRMVFKGRHNIPIVTPMYHVTKCRDRVFFLTPGPSVCCWDPGGGGFRPIEGPLGRDLYLAGGGHLLRAWYDGVRDEYILWDNTQYLGYRYSLKLDRWVGVMSYGASSTNIIGQAVIDQGASLNDADDMPWAKGLVGAGDRLLMWDHSLYTDQTGTGPTSDTFTCKVETAVLNGGDPNAEKQLTRLRVFGGGTAASIKLKYRQTPDASYTTEELFTNVSLPSQPLYPSKLPHWRECIVTVEFESASGVRFQSVEVETPIVGAV